MMYTCLNSSSEKAHKKLIVAIGVGVLTKFNIFCLTHLISICCWTSEITFSICIFYGIQNESFSLYF